MGEVIQFIPKPNPNRKTLEEQAADIVSQIVAPKDGSGIDGMKFEAPPEDCA